MIWNFFKAGHPELVQPREPAPGMKAWNQPDKNEETKMAERKQKVWRVDVAVEGGAAVLLIRAKTEKRAVDHAVAKHLRVREATHDDATALGAAGGKIEDAAE